MATILQFQGVSKRFFLHRERARSFQEVFLNLLQRRNGRPVEFWALRNVTFAVEQGETLGIIGLNGSGKSTLLKLAAGIMFPTEGLVAHRGKIAALLELGAGFHADLTGRENIYLNASFLGLGRREMNARFDAIVGFSELEPFVDMPLRHYSSGMWMRLGFAVAIHLDPDILLIDEVLSVGDGRFQQKCLQSLRTLKAQGKTMLIVSHDLGVVEDFADQVLLLDQGQQRAWGPTSQVVPLYRELLAPTPAPESGIATPGL